MDGIEWRREKWSLPERLWLWLNERLGCLLANHLIADHPEIARHLSDKAPAAKITTIPYGAHPVSDADRTLLTPFGVEADRFAVVIARPEPENSLLEIVKGFSRKKRGMRLIVLGQYQPQANPFHRQVLEAASEEVSFVGAIYDPVVLGALRSYSRFYIHGHRVGGTNPALVEAIAAGCAVLAHDNPFNRWVAGGAGVYFDGEAAVERQIEALIGDDALVAQLRANGASRFQEAFTWPKVLAEYESLLTDWSGVLPAARADGGRTDAEENDERLSND
jgi:glycosyltransferase involved in cell wall biosynthesis